MSQSAPQDQGIFEIRCIDIQGPFEPDGCLNLVPFGTKPTSSYNPWWEVSGAYGCRKCSMFGMHPRQSSNLPYPRLEHLKVLRTHFSSVFGTSQPCCRKQQYTHRASQMLLPICNIQASSIPTPMIRSCSFPSTSKQPNTPLILSSGSPMHAIPPFPSPHDRKPAQFHTLVYNIQVTCIALALHL